MTYEKVIYNGDTLVELAEGGGLIQCEGDALDLVAACIENSCNKLMISGACLCDDFFKLRIGLAGAVLQKFANYQVQAAVVAPSRLAGTGRFREFLLEANRGDQFRAFDDRDTALGWLTGKS